MPAQGASQLFLRRPQRRDAKCRFLSPYGDSHTLSVITTVEVISFILPYCVVIFGLIWRALMGVVLLLRHHRLGIRRNAGKSCRYRLWQMLKYRSIADPVGNIQARTVECAWLWLSLRVESVSGSL